MVQSLCTSGNWRCSSQCRHIHFPTTIPLGFNLLAGEWCQEKCNESWNHVILEPWNPATWNPCTKTYRGTFGTLRNSESLGILRKNRQSTATNRGYLWTAVSISVKVQMPTSPLQTQRDENVQSKPCKIKLQ